MAAKTPRHARLDKMKQKVDNRRFGRRNPLVQSVGIDADTVRQHRLIEATELERYLQALYALSDSYDSRTPDSRFDGSAWRWATGCERFYSIDLCIVPWVVMQESVSAWRDHAPAIKELARDNVETSCMAELICVWAETEIIKRHDAGLVTDAQIAALPPCRFGHLEAAAGKLQIEGSVA